MDLSKIINNEQLYTMELLHPLTEEPMGVTFKIRSSDSAEAKAVQRRHIDEIYERNRSGKPLKAKDSIQRDIEKAASFVAGWDWGQKKYEGSVPEYSQEKVIDVLTKEGWIYLQVMEAANKLANFTQA